MRKSPMQGRTVKLLRCWMSAWSTGYELHLAAAPSLSIMFLQPGKTLHMYGGLHSLFMPRVSLNVMERWVYMYERWWLELGCTELWVYFLHLIMEIGLRHMGWVWPEACHGAVNDSDLFVVNTLVVISEQCDHFLDRNNNKKTAAENTDF